MIEINLSDIDGRIKEFENWEKKLIEEFDDRIKTIDDDELKNLLSILKDLILIESALSTAKNIENLEHLRRRRNIETFIMDRIKRLEKEYEPILDLVRKEKKLRDKYL